MGHYEKCNIVRDRSIAVVVPFLEQRGWTLTPYVTEENQLTRGDYLGERLGSLGRELVNWEMKAEQAHTGNLLIEEWSNRGFRAGWFHNLRQCHRILYHFLNTGDAYVLDFPALRNYNVERWPLVHVDADQKNNTWGWKVPVRHLTESEVIIGQFKIPVDFSR